MNLNLVNVLKRAVPLNRNEKVRQLAETMGRSATAAQARADELVATREVVAAWRAAELRLARLEYEARQAALQEGYRTAALEAELRENPTPAMRALGSYIDRTMRAINHEPTPAGGLGRIGQALTDARLALRDELWRLQEAEIATRCVALRAAIEDALAGRPESPAE